METKARGMEETNDFQRAAVEAATKIIDKKEAERAKRERAEDETRAKNEADIKKKAEKKREKREA